MSARAYQVTEQTSGVLTFRLKLANGDPLPASQLTYGKLKVWVDGTQVSGGGSMSRNGLLIDNVNVINANNVTIDSAGLVTWTFTPDDMRIVFRTGELHTARWRFRWDGGNSGLEHFTRFQIVACGE